jgi:hypothetical protein
MFNVILQLSRITRALRLKTQMFWAFDGNEQGQCKYINTQTRRNGFIPPEGDLYLRIPVTKWLKTGRTLRRVSFLGKK